MEKGLVSIIIPAVKSDPILPLVIDGIVRSSYQNYEILIICEGKERSAQRNMAIKKAKGEFLLFLDSDQVIDQSLLKECVWKMQYYEALYIPEKIVTPGWFGRFRNWERKFYTATDIDVVKFIRNENVPLFDERMSGPEDSDWDRRVIGTRGVTMNEVSHYDNIGLLNYLKKKAYYSKSMALFEANNPNDKVLNFWWRCFGVFIENGKWRRLIHPYTIILILLLFIRGVIYLVNK
jgi:glycosyltransferase involved in cell wall biosynthesis